MILLYCEKEEKKIWKKIWWKVIQTWWKVKENKGINYKARGKVKKKIWRKEKEERQNIKKRKRKKKKKERKKRKE